MHILKNTGTVLPAYRAGEPSPCCVLTRLTGGGVVGIVGEMDMEKIMVFTV